MQVVVVVTLPLVYPVVVFRSVDTPLADIPAVLSWGLFVLASVVLLQAARSPVGTGYLLPALPSAIYLQPSIAAVGIGGRASLAAMTLCAGVFESAFSRVVSRFRTWFPPAVTGVIVLVVGLEIGLVAVTLGVEAVEDSLASPVVEIGVSVATFAVIVGGVVWGSLWMRNVAPIAGVAVGSALAAWLIDVPRRDSDFVAATSWVGGPGLPGAGFRFEGELLVPFLVLGLAAGLRTVGVMTTLHDTAHPDRRHAARDEVRRGVRNDGLGAVLAGAVGFPGVSSAPSAIGVSIASGIMSRVVAVGVAGVLVLLAFSPRLLAYVVTAPAAVVSALLVYYASFMIVGGVRLVTRQPLDLRATFVVGISLSLALGARVYGVGPGEDADWLTLVSSSMMTLGSLSAVLLSLVLRIGSRRRAELVLSVAGAGGGRSGALQEDLRASLDEVGVAASVAGDAVTLTGDAVERIRQLGLADGPVHARVAADDVVLSIELDYDGEPLRVEPSRPIDAEAATDENVFALGLSRYLDIARPDDVEVRTSGRRVRLRFRYELV